jgi:hypothetical protein
MERFHQIHKGETCLLVGNGINLRLTPPEWFKYPAFGMNTIHKYEGWMPTYYTAVDARVMREFGKDITEKFRDIPKFVPRPNLDLWKGDNFYRFYFRPGSLWPKRQQALWPSNLLSEDGISYSNIMTVAMQLAYFMGFTTMLIIGMQHKTNYGQDHFWGCDHGMPAQPPVQNWLDAYKVLVNGMAEQGVKILNISEDTYVPEEIIPRGNWRDWSKHEAN